MDPDQTAPIIGASDLGLHCIVKASETIQQMTKADNFCCDIRALRVISDCKEVTQ